MAKSESVRAAWRGRGRARPVVLPDAVEGQIVEICRDLAVQVKRMRQLQDQADELRVGIRNLARPSKPGPGHGPANRGGRR